MGPTGYVSALVKLRGKGSLAYYTEIVKDKNGAGQTRGFEKRYMHRMDQVQAIVGKFLKKV